MQAWYEQRGKDNALLPQNLKSRLWTPENSAADLWPFFVLTAYLCDEHAFNTDIGQTLRDEIRLTSRLGPLPDHFDIDKNAFAHGQPDLNRIIFGSAEYVKDGILPIVELTGRGAWFERGRELLVSIMEHAPVKTRFGQIPSETAEVNGDMLQGLCRYYAATADPRFKQWAERIGDAYILDMLPKSGDLPCHSWDFAAGKPRHDLLSLNDHGNEIIFGLSELLMLEHLHDPAKAAAYLPPMRKMLDRLLEVAVNEDGLWRLSVQPSTGKVLDARTPDTWGYALDAVYTFHLVTGEAKYRDAVKRALRGINTGDKYMNWGDADSFADSIEGAIVLLNRIPEPAGLEWLERIVPVFLGKQRENGIVEGWHGDGNYARTALMYALMKTAGTRVTHWRDDVRFGAVIEQSAIKVQLSADTPWHGSLCFDAPRHRVHLNLRTDYPRLNSFPEWYVVQPASLYRVTLNDRDLAPMLGQDLIRGLPVEYRDTPVRVTVQPVHDPAVMTRPARDAAATQPATAPGATKAVAAPAPSQPRDARFTTFRHTTTPFTLPRYETRDQWERRAADLRVHILASCGLWPMPGKCPLNPQVREVARRDGYTVSAVHFESYPGFYVTGNLYRPAEAPLPRKNGAAASSAVRGSAGSPPKFPAVLSPHGHWQRGRLENSDLASLPGRCINLARQGYVAFSYDMIGFNDSMQLPHDFGGKRQDLWGISLMGLQLWNSIRAVDFLCGLPEVDATRLGCTGESGGGTQTFMLAAVDDRIACAAPVNMIAAAFQGGCLCENAPSLRVDAFNVEIAAMLAPKPLLLVSCTQDWTKHTAAVEYPMIGSIYSLYGATGRLHHAHFDAPHNYNRDAREAMYAWFGRWLAPPAADEPRASQNNTPRPGTGARREAQPCREEPFTVEPDDVVRIFKSKSDLPPGAASPDELVERLIHDAQEQLARAKPKTPADLVPLRETFGRALAASLNVRSPDMHDLVVETASEKQGSAGREVAITLGRRSVGERIPATLFTPPKPRLGATGVLLIHERGRAALLPDDKPHPILAELLERSRVVLTIDAFETGENVSTAEERAARDKSPFFTTFNRTTLANRVQDILTAARYIQVAPPEVGVDMIGLGDAGLWVLLARSQCNLAGKTIIDAAGVSYTARLAGPHSTDGAAPGSDSDAVFIERFFSPGLRRAGDFATAIALCAPRPLYVYNGLAGFPTDFGQAAYGVLSAPDMLTMTATPEMPNEYLAALD